MSPEHQLLNVSCVCVACVSVWSWAALQFALLGLKIALANTPSVHPLFVLYCTVYYKNVYVYVSRVRAKCNPPPLSDTEALCQTPPSPSLLNVLVP